MKWQFLAELKLYVSLPRFYDEANVMGIGSAELSGTWIKCKVSTSYLQKIISCLKIMSLNKEGLEAVELVWAEDKPLFIGKVTKNIVSGFILAPRAAPRAEEK